MKQLRRIAIVFDDERRPETTGVYCRRALESLADVAFFRPGAIDAIPRGAFDLVLNVDDGLRYRLPDDLRPTAWWCIDTHLDMAWYLEKARDFDFVFAAQRDGAAGLQEHGIPAQWLPLACDETIHCRHDVKTQWDVSFVGNICPGPRADLVRLVQQYFPQSFVGRAYFDEMARIYSASRVVFNRSIKNDVNMRVFEALGCGSLLLTNELDDNGQAELFRDGVHLATYQSGEELLDKARFYLSRDSLREQIAAAGRQEALAKHTYRRRMEQILDVVSRSLASPNRASGPAAKAAASRERCDATPRPSVAANDSGSSAKFSQALLDGAYYDFLRPELLALTPGSARSVLDVGCGAGRLGAAIKARQPCRVTGIEANPQAGQIARQRLDQVVIGDIERLEPDFQEHGFDVVVCGDVLEHLQEPGRMLRRIHDWLRPGGTLVASVPNLAHRSVIANLLRGNWDYEPAGLLDATHLRFFTRRTVERLLYRAYFELERMEVVGGAGYDGWWRRGRPGEVDVGGTPVAGLTREQVEDLHAYQYLLAAQAVERPAFDLTSIVIVTHNALEFTRLCLERVRCATDAPYELVVIDNASTDGTADWLRQQPDVRLIANPENRGFPAAANQGIRQAEGGQIVLLNGDVLVTCGWLRRLLAAIAEDPQAGMAGPVTNCTAGLQRVADGCDDLAGLEDFAWDWAKRHAGQRVDASQLTGFCLLLRREVLEAIGLLDERFGVGTYEDVDYSLRAARAGFRMLIARDAYVHHFGHRSFLAAGVDQDALAVSSETLFREKWGLAAAETGVGEETEETAASDADRRRVGSC